MDTKEQIIQNTITKLEQILSQSKVSTNQNQQVLENEGNDLNSIFFRAKESFVETIGNTYRLSYSGIDDLETNFDEMYPYMSNHNEFLATLNRETNSSISSIIGNISNTLLSLTSSNETMDYDTYMSDITLSFSQLNNYLGQNQYNFYYDEAEMEELLGQSLRKAGYSSQDRLSENEIFENYSYFKSYYKNHFITPVSDKANAISNTIENNLGNVVSSTYHQLSKTLEKAFSKLKEIEELENAQDIEDEIEEIEQEIDEMDTELDLITEQEQYENEQLPPILDVNDESSNHETSTEYNQPQELDTHILDHVYDFPSSKESQNVTISADKLKRPENYKAKKQKNVTPDEIKKVILSADKLKRPENYKAKKQKNVVSGEIKKVTLSADKLKRPENYKTKKQKNPEPKSTEIDDLDDLYQAIDEFPDIKEKVELKPNSDLQTYHKSQEVINISRALENNMDYISDNLNKFSKELNYYKNVANEFHLSNSANPNYLIDKINSIISDKKAINKSLNVVDFSKTKDYDTLMQTEFNLSHNLESMEEQSKHSVSFGDITNKVKQEFDEEMKKSLYDKIQQTLQEAKIEKYISEKNNLIHEKVGFFQGLFGGNKVKNAKLQNLDLKIQLAKQDIPEKPKNYNIADMLADIQVCADTELKGYPDKLSQLYIQIENNFPSENLSRQNILALAQQKRTNNLPIPQQKSHRVLSKNNSLLQALREDNKRLSTKIQNGKQQNKINQYKISNQPYTLKAINELVQMENAMKDTKQSVEQLKNPKHVEQSQEKEEENVK